MIAHLTKQFRFYTLPVDQIQPTSWPNGWRWSLKKKNMIFSNKSTNWAERVKLCSDCEVNPFVRCPSLLQPQEIAGRDPPRASIRECEANPGVPASKGSCERCWCPVGNSQKSHPRRVWRCQCLDTHPQSLVRGSRELNIWGV